jgi:LmbE family N-acetylglucosaminyl deacetylase
MNKVLVLVPHQDDEIFCFSYLPYATVLATAFKGGGQPKGKKIESEELHSMRMVESWTTCEEFGIKKMFDFNIKRPYDVDFLEACIKRFFEENKYSVVITTMPVDFHEDHSILGQLVKKHSSAEFTYGFIVHTDTLAEYKDNNPPDVTIRLGEDEYERKVRLANNYETQKHFLPNVIKRKIYKTEYYWRLK